MSRTAAGIQYNARSMNGIISINADEITCSGTITSDIVKASNLLEADTPETITAQWTYNVLPQSTVVPTIGDQFTNKTYVDGAITSSLTNYVTLSTTQTITGAKTINANLRLNNTRNLIFGTTTGAVMNFTGANMYYDNQAGGGHYFFISGSPNLYIDSTGLNIESGKRIYFNGGRCSITDNGTQLVYDVPTGNSHSFRTNNTQRVTISADTNGTLFTFPAGTIMREYTSFNWFLYQLPAAHTLKYQVGGVDIMEVSNGGAIIYESLSMRNGKRVVWDEGFTNIAYLRKDTTTSTFDYEVATGYSHKFMVNSVTQLLLNTSGATFTNPIFMKATQPIYLDDTLLGGAIASGGSGGIRFDADTGGEFRFINDGTLALTISGTNITIPTNQTFTFGVTGSNITYFAGTTLRYNVPTGDNHAFRVNAVDSFLVDVSGCIVNSTAVGAAPVPDKMLYLSANKANYIGSTTTDMRYNCSSGGSHNFFQNNTTYLGFWNSLGIGLSPNNASLQIGTTSTAQIKHDTATSQLQYRTIGSFNHIFYIDGTAWYEMRTDTFRMLRGWQCKQGATGAYVSNNLNTSWNVPVPGLSCWIDTTRLGTFTISDYRVKEAIVPARPVLDRLCKVKMYEYEHKNISIFKKSGRHHGFIAHEVQELFPELNNIVAGEKDALTDDGLVQPQSIQPEWTNLYLSAIQELNAKIETQQKVIEDQQRQIDQLLVLFSQSRV
jgi:hypothetical protein